MCSTLFVKHFETMTKLSYTLFLAVFLSVALTGTYAEDEESTADEGCQNGPNGLALFGGQRTCIESPEFRGKRCFFTLIPECAGEDSPLVFDLHGYDSCPTASVFYTGWRQLAQEQCFVLVYPVGTTDPDIAERPCWGFPGGVEDDNGRSSPPCCCEKENLPVVTNDGAFFRQIAAVTARDVPIDTSGSVTIDTKRIYMGGHSNGCMASISMAAQNSDMVAAVGCHAGYITTPFAETYNPTPMAFIHGTADPDVIYDGSGVTFGTEAMQAIVSKVNGCTMFAETRTLSFDTTANNMTEFAATSCANNASVVLYALDNVGHIPYPAAEALGLNEEGTTPTRIDTTEMLWDFVKGYSLETAPELVAYEMPETGAPSASPTESPTESPTSSSSYVRMNGSVVGYLAMIIALIAAICY
jgi:polyhydroxybutyrate depolymerase